MKNILLRTSGTFVASFLAVFAQLTNFDPSKHYHPCVRRCERNVSMTCHYHFNLEYYVTMGKSCVQCQPTSSHQQLYNIPTCQCVFANGYERGVLTINRMIPGPSIHVCFGDTVIVDVHNFMEGLDTSIHWHGIHQRGSQYFDGVPFVTQCPILGGNSFRYRFKADKPGTHFYHSHSGSQKLDGLYGSFVIRLPSEQDPHKDLYDEDLPMHTIIISDFMHTVSSDYFPGHMHSRSGQYPDSFLINGLGRYVDWKTGEITSTPYEIFTVRRNVRYRFRIINSLGTTCDAALTVEKHSMIMIASDGDEFEPVEVDTITSYSGERFDVVLNTNQVPGDYWIQVTSGECYANKPFQLAILRYEEKAERELPRRPNYDHPLPAGRIYNTDCFLSSTAVCITDLRSMHKVEEDILKVKADLHIDMPFELYYYNEEVPFTPNTYRRFLVPPSTKPLTGLLGGISFNFPTAPPLSQREANASLCFPQLDSLPRPCNKDSCSCPHTWQVDLNDVLEILLIDYSANRYSNLTHPFHMHGHSFHVMDLGKLQPDWEINEGTLKIIFDKYLTKLSSGEITKPISKDTIVIPHNGYALIRAKMNNPGYWFFHCHFVYHIVVGMNLILQVGRHTELPPVPENFPRCGDFKPDY